MNLVFRNQSASTSNLMDDLFGSDSVLPSQFYGDRTPALTGEQKLLWTVLMDALRCVRTGGGASIGSKRHQEYLDARSWLEGAQDPWHFDCEGICDSIGVDYGKLQDLVCAGRIENGPKFRRSPAVSNRQMRVVPRRVK